MKRSTNIRCLYGYNEKIPKGTESRVKGKNKNHLINTERRLYLREVVKKRYFYGQEIGPKFSHLLTFAFPNQMDICVDHLEQLTLKSILCLLQSLSRCFVFCVCSSHFLSRWHALKKLSAAHCEKVQPWREPLSMHFLFGREPTRATLFPP